MARRKRPRACAYSGQCLLPQYQGCVWDLRDSRGAKPLDYGRPLATHLNSDFYRRAMPGPDAPDPYPDQELRDAMLHGFRYQAFEEPRHHQFVVLPHLLSIGQAFPAVQSELRRLAGRTKIEIWRDPPFWPLRCTCQGTTPRRYEPGRDRRTSDGGAPREDLYDCAQQKVYSLNEESIKPRVVGGVLHPVPKEHKPTLQKLFRDMAILLHLAYISGESLYLFADDFADYFNQFDLAAEELWKSVVHTLAIEGDPGFDRARPHV